MGFGRVQHSDDGRLRCGRQALGQIWICVYLCCLGPVPHFLMGMPGPRNIFDGKGTPKERTQMHALTGNTLGTCCFWIASYAVVHFIVFVRKEIDV